MVVALWGRKKRVTVDSGEQTSTSTPLSVSEPLLLFPQIHTHTHTNFLLVHEWPVNLEIRIRQIHRKENFA